MCSEICQWLGFKKTNDLDRYRGANIIQGRVNRYTFKNTIDKIKAKLSDWKAKNLSLAGRVTLANSVLQVMPIYPMLTAKFPALTCNEIDKLIKNFIWGSDEASLKMHLVSWEVLCQPKCNGGLGIRSAKDMNTLLLMKLGW